MAVYQMNRPTPSLVTMKFKTYNAAVDFAAKSGMMKPTKPYKRILNIDGELLPIWCVTMPQIKPEQATYRKAA